MGGSKCAGAKRRHVDGRYLYAAEEMSAQSLAAVDACTFVDVPQKEAKLESRRNQLRPANACIPGRRDVPTDGSCLATEMGSRAQGSVYFTCNLEVPPHPSRV